MEDIKTWGAIAVALIAAFKSFQNDRRIAELQNCLRNRIDQLILLTAKSSAAEGKLEEAGRDHTFRSDQDLIRKIEGK